MAAVKTLFAQGYRVRLVVGLWNQFEVRNADGKVYRVSPFSCSCSCPATKVCKHLIELRGLVSEQAKMWAELQSVERDADKGEMLDKLAWNLMSVSSRIWGAGEMSIDTRYAVQSQGTMGVAA